MKVILGSGHGKTITVYEAVVDKLTPRAYSYDGQLEKFQEHIDLQSEMIVKLVTLIEAKLKISAEEMEELLGYGYKVED